MRTEKLLILICFFSIFWPMTNLQGQRRPSFFPAPEITTPRATAEALRLERLEQQQQQQQQTQTRDAPQLPASEATGFEAVPYDPSMDNHLKAPADKTIGMFGMPVREAETILKNYGAKSFSYAFGKYSRLSLASYIVTLHFDRQRKVAGISITARPPFTRIEAKAREFFLELFLDGNDLSSFDTIMSGDLLELKYRYP